MPLRRLFLIIMVVIAVIGAGILFFPVDKKAAVTKLLDEGMSAIEREDFEKLDKLISLYYKDSMGFTYASMRGNFSYVFREYDDIKVSRSSDSIVIGKDTCVAYSKVWLRGTWLGKPADMVGTETAYEPVVIFCVKALFRWKVIGSWWPERKSPL
jgi:hypothetical protein